MGADDDADCFEHIWVLEEVIIGSRSAEMVSTCRRCGAISYEPSGSANPNRPKL